MKKVEIVSGNFSTAGNYSGYDDDGQRYFVPQRLMENHGWKTNEQVVFPFFAKTAVNKINPFDENNQPLMKDGAPVIVDRPQVMSIYKTEQEIIDHEIRKASMDVKIAAGIKAVAVEAGLTQSIIDTLVTAL